MDVSKLFLLHFILTATSLFITFFFDLVLQVLLQVWYYSGNVLFDCMFSLYFPGIPLLYAIEDSKD